MTEAAEPQLVRERQGNVLIARLNRPEARNALTPEIISGMAQRDIQNPTVRT